MDSKVTIFKSSIAKTHMKKFSKYRPVTLVPNNN